VRFWDSSGLVPLVLEEPTSSTARRAFDDDSDLVVWWGSSVECASAIARAERDARLDASGSANALAGLRLLQSGWTEVDPTVRLRESAERMVRVHPIRAADALQLAAALVAAEGQPATLPFLTLDARLANAADREGFPVVHIEPNAR
jgi:uncharacterized protein